MLLRSPVALRFLLGEFNSSWFFFPCFFPRSLAFLTKLERLDLGCNELEELVNEIFKIFRFSGHSSTEQGEIESFILGIMFSHLKPLLEDKILCWSYIHYVKDSTHAQL